MGSATAALVLTDPLAIGFALKSVSTKFQNTAVKSKSVDGKESHLSDAAPDSVRAGALMLSSTLISAALEIDPPLEDPLLRTVLTRFTSLLKPCLFSVLSGPAGANELISGRAESDGINDERPTFAVQWIKANSNRPR